MLPAPLGPPPESPPCTAPATAPTGFPVLMSPVRPPKIAPPMLKAMASPLELVVGVVERVDGAGHLLVVLVGDRTAAVVVLTRERAERLSAWRERGDLRSRHHRQRGGRYAVQGRRRRGGDGRLVERRCGAADEAAPGGRVGEQLIARFETRKVAH